MASPAILSDTPAKKPRKSSVVRKSSIKPPSVQSAIAIRRANGQSKRQIAKALDISPNTVTNVLALNDIESQIAKAREDAIALAPVAVIAINKQLESGDGALGLRLLNDIGAIGEDAIESARLHTVRQRGAINVLVQSGASVTIPSVAVPAGNHNVPLSDAPPTNSIVANDVDNRTIPVNDKVTDGHGTPTGKHPKAAPTHQ